MIFLGSPPSQLHVSYQVLRQDAEKKKVLDAHKWALLGAIVKITTQLTMEEYKNVRPRDLSIPTKDETTVFSTDFLDTLKSESYVEEDKTVYADRIAKLKSQTLTKYISMSMV